VNTDGINTIMSDYSILLSLEISGKNEALFDVVQTTLTQF
jgi:hypothetical protein